MALFELFTNKVVLVRTLQNTCSPGHGRRRLLPEYLPEVVVYDVDTPRESVCRVGDTY